MVTLTCNANKYKVHKLHQYLWWSLCTLHLLTYKLAIWQALTYKERNYS